MYVLGWAGGNARIHEFDGEALDGGHDAAAALLCDGRVVAAIEEERLSRLKHTCKFPVQSLRFCLDKAGLRPDEIDAFAFYQEEAMLRHFSTAAGVAGRDVVRSLLREAVGADIPDAKLHWVPHHCAHAMSAYGMSGYDDALVVTWDGVGGNLSGLVARVEQGAFEVLRGLNPGSKTGQSQSLGYLWEVTLPFLGYGLFDEYKVMGLAPYGDPARYREIFQQAYTLRDDGQYVIRLGQLEQDLHAAFVRRTRGAPFEQTHKDLSAGLQEAFESLAMHVLRHFRAATGLQSVCLAGGAAHNCTLNGKILSSGLFDRVFVQPASHDAGCALGAALWVQNELGGGLENEAISHVFWGTDVSTEDVSARLARWRDLVEVSRPRDVFAAAARLLAEGRVLGWVQGRSEFGPRALGNRSIVADPRPPENKARINAMVKKREGYRPFAPAVLVERAREFFDVPEGNADLPFMTFVVPVREAHRSTLGAVTHVDGTARVQTVAREHNGRFWSLIKAFEDLTGTPIVLNTSFNNNAEPIVDSIDEAIACLLTTGLDGLVVDDYLVTKRSVAPSAFLDLAISLPDHVVLQHVRRSDAPGHRVDEYVMRSTDPSVPSTRLSQPTFELLLAVNGGRSPAEWLAAHELGAARELVERELLEAWARRQICLHPGGA
jgi:carbamoyltransferase